MGGLKTHSVVLKCSLLSMSGIQGGENQYHLEYVHETVQPSFQKIGWGRSNSLKRMYMIGAGKTAGSCA